jgi:hypothetical protein
MARVLAGQIEMLDAAQTIASLTRARLAAFQALGLDWYKAEHDLDDLRAAHAAKEREERERAAKSAAAEAEAAIEGDRPGNHDVGAEGAKGEK